MRRFFSEGGETGEGGGEGEGREGLGERVVWEWFRRGVGGRGTDRLTHCRINGLGVGEVLGGTARREVNPVALVAPQPLSYLVPLHDDERRGDQLVAPRTGPHPQLSVHVPTNRVERREDLGPMAQGTTCGRIASHNIHAETQKTSRYSVYAASSQRNQLSTGKTETASCGRFFGRKSTLRCCHSFEERIMDDSVQCRSNPRIEYFKIRHLTSSYRARRFEIIH